MFVVWDAQSLLRSQGIGFVGDSSENRVTYLQNFLLTLLSHFF